jgi:hypothetical protein
LKYYLIIWDKSCNQAAQKWFSLLSLSLSSSIFYFLSFLPFVFPLPEENSKSEANCGMISFHPAGLECCDDGGVLTQAYKCHKIPWWISVQR